MAGQLDKAKREFERARNINCPLDPMIHNVEVTRDTHSKDEMIACVRKMIDSELLYIEVAKQDDVFVRILSQLGGTRAADAHNVLKAALDLADARPHSVRAKVLYPHIVLDLLGSGRLLDSSRDRVLRRALCILEDMSDAFPASLVVSLLYAKLLVALVFFYDSEKECVRALKVEVPDDPLSHDIPLALTYGSIYDDRVILKKQKIFKTLDTVIHMVKVEFNKLSEEQKCCFLSVKVIELLEEKETHSDQVIAAKQAIEQYRSYHSLYFWRCPSEQCDGFETADMLDLLLHLYSAHICALDTEVEICYHVICARLKQVHHVPLAGIHEDLYIAVDGEGNDYICISNMESLFSGIYRVLPGLIREEHRGNISPAEALDIFMNCVILDDEVCV